MQVATSAREELVIEGRKKESLALVAQNKGRTWSPRAVLRSVFTERTSTNYDLHPSLFHIA